MTAVEAEALTLLAEPYHDGASAEVEDEIATVRLRVPQGTEVDTIVLRSVWDGEPVTQVAEPDAEEGWWRASFPVTGRRANYRWLLGGGSFGYAWVNGDGLVRHDVPDSDDFVVARDGGGPDWHLGSVVYQIFPDRFSRRGATVDAPDWAIERDWDTLPIGRGPETPFELYGGDLPGIEAHLDHIEQLGANVIYLTPIFPAGSSHRYDSTTFDHVDPLLGGDDALRSLVSAAHARGLRVVGDLTTNHVGDQHEWFRAARDEASPEREFFYFDKELDHGYASWYGIPTLPKLDLRSTELRRRLDAVVRKWLEPPFELDGWRIDVANMTGRYGEIDVNHEVQRELRRSVGDNLLVAEHAHDAHGDIQGDGWHGTMNYPGFTRPVWTWLRGDEPPGELGRQFFELPVGVPRLGGNAAVAAMRAFRAGVPWPSTLHSWVLLDSHDTARFRTVAGSRERQLVGVGLQMTTPGVPMIFAGDELGLEGEWGEDARRTIPWDRPESWDAGVLEEYRRLVALRRSHEALARGGIRYAHIGEDAIAYLRETPREALLCLASRADHAPIRLPLDLLGCDELETLYGADATLLAGDAVLPADGPAFSIWKLERSSRG